MNKRIIKKKWKQARERARLHALQMDPRDPEKATKQLAYFLIFGELIVPGVGAFAAASNANGFYMGCQITDAAGRKVRRSFYTMRFMLSARATAPADVEAL